MMAAYRNQSLLELEQDIKTDVVLNMLKHTPYIHIGRRKIKMMNVVVLKKDNTSHIVGLPAFNHDINWNYDQYVPLKEIILENDKLVFGRVVSGLNLIVTFHGGLKNGISKFNTVSKDIGEYQLFGKIESLVVTTTGNRITF